MKVQDPTGQTWRVTRRWVPWRRHLRGGIGAIPDLSIGSDPIFGVIALIIAIPFILVAVVASLELLLLLLVFPFALLGRVVLGRHWTVEVRRGFRPWWEIEAGDCRAGAVRIHEIADQIRTGAIPERGSDAPGTPPEKDER